MSLMLFKGYYIYIYIFFLTSYNFRDKTKGTQALTQGFHLHFLILYIWDHFLSTIDV